MSSSVRPCEIHIDDAKIDKLRALLDLQTLPDEVEGVPAWERGTPLSEIRRLTSRWRSGFDWRAIEEQLNTFPQFYVDVNVTGFGPYAVHCVHQRSKVANAIPLLFVHGWPGSFVEATKLIPLLTAGGSATTPSFHVVAPSLLNFGFSPSVNKAGFDSEKQAEAMHQVMLNLGYDQYVVQGGDIGYTVARFLALKFPESCKAHHINMVSAEEPKEEAFPNLVRQIRASDLTEFEKKGLARTQEFLQKGMAYAMLHATRPQTVAYTLSDSPVGLLAWIYEKLHEWTDSYPWTDDEILTWVSIYWFSTAGPHASVRWYCDSVNCQPSNFNKVAQYVDVKLGISRFPMETVHTPFLWAHTLGPVVLDECHDRGGHFAAWENPEGLARDLKKMFGEGGGAFGATAHRGWP